MLAHKPRWWGPSPDLRQWPVATAGGRGTWQPAGSSLSSARSATVASVSRHGPHPASGGWGERACARPDRNVGVLVNSLSTYCRTPKQELFALELLSRRRTGRCGIGTQRLPVATSLTHVAVPRQPESLPGSLRGGPRTRSVWGPASWSLCRLPRGACGMPQCGPGGSATAAETPALLQGKSRQPPLCVPESSGRWAWQREASCGRLWKVWPEETRSRISRERPASLW